MKTRPLHIVIALALAATPAGAAITVIHEYQMGEDAHGTDSVGALNLGVTGSLITVASGVTGSTSAVRFAGNPTHSTHNSTATNFLDGGTAPTIAGSWGVEMWVNPAGAMPNGSTQNEIGLIHIGPTNGGLALEIAQHPTFGDGNLGWGVHRTGVGLSLHNAATGVGAPTVGAWTHLAYVYDATNGTTLYVDGTASSVAPAGGITGAGAPDLTLGSMWSDNRRGFNGDMDAVRIFTFADGAFDINDTYVNGIPEPSSLTFIGLAGLGLLRRRRK